MLGIAIVGSRRPSTYGKVVAEQLARGLVTRGVTVVSGMALGRQPVDRAIIAEVARDFDLSGRESSEVFAESAGADATRKSGAA